MAPHEKKPLSTANQTLSQKQSIFIVRHGDRWDYTYPEWKNTAKRLGDPPLSPLGKRQARETGTYLNSLLASEGISSQQLMILSSPFLRCLQTSDEIVSQFETVSEGELIPIRPECSVWEIDGHDGFYHKDLPPVSERKCYFARLDENHESLFIPSLPESKTQFVTRCEEVIQKFNQQYPYIPNTAFIIVTHAAGCIAIAKAATKMALADINPAAPCGIFRLTRSDDSEKWDIDHHTEKGGMNGYTDHISEMGKHTTPWNHFGPRHSSYTGPTKV